MCDSLVKPSDLRVARYAGDIVAALRLYKVVIDKLLFLQGLWAALFVHVTLPVLEVREARRQESMNVRVGTKRTHQRRQETITRECM